MVWAPPIKNPGYAYAGQDFLDPTGKFQNLCRLTGRSTVSDWPGRLYFFTKGFCSLFNASNEKFSKRGGTMGEVLKFVTPHGGLRKKTNLCVFCKNDSNLRPLWLSFVLKDLF